ncbi:MAG: hypothetical protein ACPLPQ_10340 [Candidatus Saccharicenans sp.]
MPVIKFTAILIYIFSFFVQSEVGNIVNKKPPEPPGLMKNIKLILIINQDFIECPLCQNSLDIFLEFIKTHELENNILGILSIDKDNRNDENRIKFMQKQLRGYIIGNNIRFPVLIDRSGIFMPKTNKAPVLIYFNYGKRYIDLIKFPIDYKYLEELIDNEEVGNDS